MNITTNGMTDHDKIPSDANIIHITKMAILYLLHVNSLRTVPFSISLNLSIQFNLLYTTLYAIYPLCLSLKTASIAHNMRLMYTHPSIYANIRQNEAHVMPAQLFPKSLLPSITVKKVAQNPTTHVQNNIFFFSLLFILFSYQSNFKI